MSDRKTHKPVWGFLFDTGNGTVEAIQSPGILKQYLSQPEHNISILYHDRRLGWTLVSGEDPCPLEPYPSRITASSLEEGRVVDEETVLVAARPDGNRYLPLVVGCPVGTEIGLQENCCGGYTLVIRPPPGKTIEKYNYCIPSADGQVMSWTHPEDELVASVGSVYLYRPPKASEMSQP